MFRAVKGVVLLKLLWLLCTASLVYAADRAAISPETIPAAKWAYALALSFWGGITMLLQKFARGDITARWPLAIGSGVVSSVSAGVLIFFGALHMEVPPLLNAIAVFIAGYGGSRTLDSLFTRLEKQIGEAKP